MVSFESALKHFLLLWNLELVTGAFNNQRFRDPLNHAMNKQRYAAGKHNAIYLVKEKRKGLFRKNPLWVLRISKEPMICTRLKNDIRLHKNLAKHGIALGFKTANTLLFGSELCYQAMLLPFADHTLRSLLQSNPGHAKIQWAAEKVFKLIHSIASKGFFLEDILPQNLVISNDQVYIIDVESSEIEENLRPENAQGYMKEMLEQVMRSLPRNESSATFKHVIRNLQK